LVTGQVVVKKLGAYKTMKIKKIELMAITVQIAKDQDNKRTMKIKTNKP
jgi:hypothetical protein